MKQGLLFGFLIIALIIAVFEIQGRNTMNYYTSNDSFELDKFQINLTKAKEAETWCKANKYNTKFCFLVNYSLHSGLPRFYIFDFLNQSFIDSGLVSHGCGTNNWGKDEAKDKPIFSNNFESHSSSLGKYQIANKGISQWGIKVKYTLKGLDSTNSNALKRFVVLHSWEAVEDKAAFPNGTPEGWGCPAVSNNFMKKIDSLIQKQPNKKMLLWVYN